MTSHRYRSVDAVWRMVAGDLYISVGAWHPDVLELSGAAVSIWSVLDQPMSRDGVAGVLGVERDDPMLFAGLELLESHGLVERLELAPSVDG